jgi:hypothetical protein
MCIETPHSNPLNKRFEIQKKKDPIQTTTPKPVEIRDPGYRR